MGDVTDATREAERIAARGEEIARRLAEVVGGRAGTQAIFGDAVERDGVTVIPVGAVRWGVGGGGGSGGPSSKEGEGAGGGGGMTATPVGYIEIAGGTAGFRRIGPSVSPGLMLACGVAAMLVLRGLRALVR
ncbi:MAG: spore germination protein GerW family protein [Thermoleophilia bacterium]